MENLNYQLQQSTKEELIQMLTEIAEIISVDFGSTPIKHEKSYKHLEIANVFSAIVSGEYYNDLENQRKAMEKPFVTKQNLVSTRL